jgi:hypothetical protein
MATFATSLKRSKHNDEKRMSEFLLNEEIPRLEGIACAVCAFKFGCCDLMFQQCQESVQRGGKWNLS